MSAGTWQPVIGLEVHAQLATRSKLFCACPSSFGAPPNTNVCEVCTGQPGALPVLNERALALGVRAALALGCEVARTSAFDRKNYFYCDLPKGYQITQYDQPFARGGEVVLADGKRVRLRRIHLEEDAGKAIHAGDATLVDLNRAGVPLIEAVSEPDLRSAAEAHEYLERLREVLRHAGVSDGDMEKGSLRCDVNVSVRRPGAPLGTRVELKNLNSFRHVRDAIEFELARQRTSLERGAASPERVVQETRLWDPERGVTRTMRTKEEAEDYRYFPDPDLPPVVVDEELLARERAALPELPAARRARYRSELGLSAYDAGVLTAEREVAEFFDATVRAGADPKHAANWLANDVLGALADPAVPATRLGELALRPARLAELLALLADGTLSTPAARRVLAALLHEDAAPRALVERLGLAQVSDETALRGWCQAALAARPEVVAAVRAGNEKALGAAIGPVMQASGGRANPRLVRALLERLVEELP